MELPTDYIIEKFYQIGMRASQSGSGVYNCECPICMEGKSRGKKKRCYYMENNNNIYCHNCGWSSTPLKWIMEAGNLTYKEVMTEIRSGNYSTMDIDKYISRNEIEEAKSEVDYTLPSNSVNLYNENQVNYYKDNKTVQMALKFVRDRRLDTAVNRPKALYVSLDDTVHKNRLIIPYYNVDGKLVWYQSRRLLNDGSEKYLSGYGQRRLFGMDKIDYSKEYVCVTEGPIDAFFIPNCTCVSGISKIKDSETIENVSKSIITQTLKDDWELLNIFLKLYVLDNPNLDKTAKKVSEILKINNEEVYPWSDTEVKQYKDVNDYCVAKKVDEFQVNYDFEPDFSLTQYDKSITEEINEEDDEEEYQIPKGKLAEKLFIALLDKKIEQSK